MSPDKSRALRNLLALDDDLDLGEIVDTRPLLVVDLTDAVLFKVDQAAKITGLNKNWLADRAMARAIPCTYPGHNMRFSVADLRALVAQYAIDPKTRQYRQPQPSRRRT